MSAPSTSDGSLSALDSPTLRAKPRHWRPLAGGYVLLVVAFATLTVLVALVRDPLYPAYELALPVVLFLAPALAGLACGVLGGGLFPALSLGAVPSLGWALAVLVSDTVRLLFSLPQPIPDSPLWAITGGFLIVGLGGACGGFVVGRLALLAWRRRRPRR